MDKASKIVFCASLFVVTSLHSAARAGIFELVSGWEGNDRQGYASLMPSQSIDVGKNFLVLHASANYLYYEFTDVGGLTEVTSPGAGAGVSFRWTGERLTFSAGPGYEVRRTERTLAGGAKQEETEHGFNLQSSLFFQANPLTNFSLIASYSAANKYIWARGGVKRQISNKLFDNSGAFSLGAEITGQGNDDTEVYHAGLFVEVAHFPKRVSLQLRSGYPLHRYPDLDESRPYFGLSIYKAF
jgi:hypothetical protein